ncbi:MAG TPA: YdcF family protein, partial [Candidatus Mediterraneibacter merdavium]|nr:YdcF family protein [Candidatus Mediterraneibacter merdavium]
MNKAELINILGKFCGKRDIPNLTQKSLHSVYGIKKVDVFVLFGGSILEGGNVLAEAIKAK